MKRKTLVAVGALSLLAATACSTDIGDGTKPGDPGTTPGENPGMTPGENPGMTPGQTPGTTPGQTPGTTPGQTPGTTPGTTPGENPGTIQDPVGTCVPGLPSATQIPKLKNRQYANAVRDLVGITALNGEPLADTMYADFTGAMTRTAWESYQSTAAKVAAAVMADPAAKAKFISCDPAAAGCLKTTIETFGAKAFRRPLRADEVEKFEALGKTEPAGTPEQVATAVLEAFLVSPSFLLMPEVGKIGADGNAIAEAATTADGTPAVKLSSREVAAKLSFLIWGSIPDAALEEAAAADQLQTAEQIRAQADRMLKVQDKSADLIASFHREWARMNDSGAHWFEGRDHDPAKFPGYKPEAKESYKAELNAFFADVAFSGGSFKDLFQSPVGFVNKDNAHIYGLDPAAYGTELTKVNLEGRPGFLTRAGFLSSYSNYDASSPILRGAFLGIWVLSLPIGAPDPEATKKTVTGTYETQRAYVEALTEKDGACAGCHLSVNPPGYILEKFDAIGKVQTKDPRGGNITEAVTTANVIFGTKADGTPDSRPISSPEQLMQAVGELPTPANRYSKVWVEFAYDRDNNQYDQCVVDQIAGKIKAGAYPILTLAADLTQVDSFRMRNVVQ